MTYPRRRMHWVFRLTILLLFAGLIIWVWLAIDQ